MIQVQFQDNQRIETRLLAALVSTCSVSTSTSTTPTDSRPINFNSRMGHMPENTFCLVRILGLSWLPKIFNPKCVAPVSLSQQLEQNRCQELIPGMGKAVKKR
jgi:hypothetical protein